VQLRLAQKEGPYALLITASADAIYAYNQGHRFVAAVVQLANRIKLAQDQADAEEAASTMRYVNMEQLTHIEPRRRRP
jgi:hypothetical protein